MKLTMNIVGTPVVQLPPLINFIGVGIYYPPNPSLILIREKEIRPLTLWDMTTDLLPIQPLVDNDLYKLIEWGDYNNGTYIPSSDPKTVLYDDNASDYVFVGTDVNGSDLYTTLDDTNMRYFVSFTDMYPHGYPNYYYLRFLRGSDDREIYIHFYKGTEKVTYPTMTYEKTYSIPPGTITPLNIQEMFDRFDYNDPYLTDLLSTINEIGEPVTQTLQQLYGEISTDKFLKMYVLKPSYTPVYGIEPVPRLSINGNPLYYGQALNFNQVTNGSVLIDTVGLNIGDSLVFNFGIEGVINIKIHCRVA